MLICLLFLLQESIYVEWFDIFGEFDTFHMGADEVKFGCWNDSQQIVDYMKDNDMPRTREGRKKSIQKQILLLINIVVRFRDALERIPGEVER